MDLSGKRALVMGLGRFGGGVGAAGYLARRGAQVQVTDLLPADQLRQSLAKLEGLAIDYRLGQHDERDFMAADLIVVNPAVDRQTNRFLRAAQAAGIPMTSEIQLLIESLPERPRTIGVTGTAGKSTVTAMIHHILSDCALGQGRARIGGNLGGSLLEEVDDITSDDWVVLELSSFMLEGLSESRWSPHIAVVTNLCENHLDRHRSMKAYTAAKQVILAHQNSHDHAVLGHGLDPPLQPQAGHVWHVQAGPALPLAIPGPHNQLNATMAIQAAVCAGIDADQAAQSVVGFTGLPDRLELVCDHDGVRYYNDSKATTPQASMLAISSLNPNSAAVDPAAMSGTVHVILGGYDKAADLAALGQFAGQQCRTVYTIGATGDAIADAAQAGPAQVIRCHSLDRAVEESSKRAHNGDVVVLSPGCASWDQFENYQERGHAFKTLVLKHRT